MNKEEFKCDLNCPVSIPVQFCCKGCKNSKKEYKNKDNEHLWSDEFGFWTPDGCGLSREQMPKECRTYNCRDYVFAVERRWKDGKWEDFATNSMLKHNKLVGIITAELDGSDPRAHFAHAKNTSRKIGMYLRK